MRLTDEEFRDVLARATEIEREAQQREERSMELTSVLAAAEEAGLSRRAVERALRERLNLPAALPAVGTLAWARSADDKHYVAEVISVSEEGARVRFLRGSEHQVALNELRPCAFIPGDRVACYWPMWGSWTCTVVSYDAEKQRVKLNDGWGYTRKFPVSEVWLPPAAAAPGPTGKRIYGKLLGAGAVAGALIGSILTLIFLR
jgi:hypothetical protein